jgi:cation:H+ antiporter
MLAFLAFAVAAAVLIVAAVFLAKAADAIAEITGIGRVWIGALVLATATSLPELATDIAAVRIGAVDLAAGDLFGSSLSNMLILGIVDIALPRARLVQRAAFDHALIATLAIGLTALATAFIVIRLDVGLGTVGVGPLVILAVYLAAMRSVFYKQKPPPRRPTSDENAAEPPGGAKAKGALTRPILTLVAASGAVLVAAPFAAKAAEEIAVITGLGNTFVGTALVGFTTSLPELVASIAAVRMGAIDLAVGNLFGSNAFNMIIFAALDLAEPSTGLFTTLSPAHAISGLLAIVVMCLALAAIIYRAERRFRLLPLDSLLIVLGFALSLLMLRLYG